MSEPAARVKAGWHSKCPTLTAMPNRAGFLMLAIPLAVLAALPVAVGLVLAVWIATAGH